MYTYGSKNDSCFEKNEEFYLRSEKTKTCLSNLVPSIPGEQASTDLSLGHL
jgi:hypothetical protein